MNLCTLPVRDGKVAFGSVTLDAVNGRDEVIVGVRPEALQPADVGIDARVDAVEELGLDAYVFCTADLPGGPARLAARIDARRAPERGERVRLRPSREYEPHFFSADSGERL